MNLGGADQYYVATSITPSRSGLLTVLSFFFLFVYTVKSFLYIYDICKYEHVMYIRMNDMQFKKKKKKNE
jgi:hypothetical protein